MLMPKKVKFRKEFRGKRRGIAWRGSSLVFGEYGLQATECGQLFSQQIEAARRAVMRYIKRGGKLWIRVFPQKSVTRKPNEVRMGGGKGAPTFWAVEIKPGRVLFEINGVAEDIAHEAMRRARHKLPMQSRFIKRDLIN